MKLLISATITKACVTISTMQYNSNLTDQTVRILILSSTSILSEQEKIQLQSDFENTSLQKLLSLSLKHGVLPVVYQNLKALSSQNKILEQLTDELKPYYLRIAKRNIFMSAELLKIMKLFEAHRIQALSFKGPLLALDAYGDITLRQYGDLDILVKYCDLPLILELMQAEGYICDVHIPSKHREELFKMLTVIGFDNPSNGLRIEIHWELLSRNYAISWDTESLWKKKKNIPINHVPVPTLSYEDLLLYICVHGSKHLFERLEWICDIDRVVRVHNADIDWERVSQTAKNTGIYRMFLLGLALAQSFFTLPLPEEIRQEIKKDRMLTEIIQKIIILNFSTPKNKTVDTGYFILLLQMRERLSDQLRFSYQAFFAPQFNDFNYLPLPKYLHFLYPFVRLFRLGKKYLFKR